MNPHLSKGAAVLKIVSLEIYRELESYDPIYVLARARG